MNVLFWIVLACKVRRLGGRELLNRLVLSPTKPAQRRPQWARSGQAPQQRPAAGPVERVGGGRTEQSAVCAERWPHSMFKTEDRAYAHAGEIPSRGKTRRRPSGHSVRYACEAAVDAIHLSTGLRGCGTRALGRPGGRQRRAAPGRVNV